MTYKCVIMQVPHFHLVKLFPSSFLSWIHDFSTSAMLVILVSKRGLLCALKRHKITVEKQIMKHTNDFFGVC